MSLYLERRKGVDASGTYIVDRVFGGVRIKRATGARTLPRARAIEAMLVALYERDRLDVLQAIASGAVSLAQVWTVWEHGDRRRLPTAESMRPLRETWETWAKGAASEAHRRNHRQALALLLKGERPGATVADLPPLLKAYRRRAGGPVMFNRVRASVLAFLRDEVGRRHRLYEEVGDVAAHPERAAPGIKLTVAEMRMMGEGLGAYGPMAWSLVLTGMRRGEYWGRWDVLEDRVRIHGTKTAGSVRDVPRVGQLVRPYVGYQAFRRALQRVRAGFTPHDFRHTYMHWLDEAGVSRIRRRLYLGHGVGDVSGLYEAPELGRFLAGDARLLADYVGAIPAPVRLVG